MFNLRSLRSHSRGLCPGRHWDPGPPKDPTARAVGFNHCPGRSGQNLGIFSGSLSNSVRLEIAIWISEVLDRSGSSCAMPPKQLQYPIFWTRVLSRQINFSSSGGLLFLPRPGDQSGPRSVPERRAITAHLSNRAQAATRLESGATKGHPSGRR